MTSTVVTRDCVVSIRVLGAFVRLSVELSCFVGAYELAHLYCVQFYMYSSFDVAVLTSQSSVTTVDVTAYLRPC